MIRWRLAQWAEIRWWKRYLKKREPRTYLAWKMGYWNDFLQRIGGTPAPGARVLDAGCGPAGIFMALPGCRVDAVDPLLPDYSGMAHFQPESYSWVAFHAQELESFPISNPYDWIFCINALNHMRDIPAAVGQLHQALKPGATLVVSVDAHKYRFLRRLFRLLPGDVLHPLQEDLSGYRTLFSNAGFLEISALRYKKGRIFDYWIFRLTISAGSHSSEIN